MLPTLVSRTHEHLTPANVTAEILLVLQRGYGMRVVGTLTNAILVAPAFDREAMRQPQVVALWDNGGEIDIQIVNGARVASIPMTSFGSPVSASTLAYRLGMSIKGRHGEIDWSANAASDLVSSFASAA